MKRFFVNQGFTSAPSFLLSDTFCILSVIIFSLAGFAQITKYFHGAQQILFAAGIAIVVIAAMLWLRQMHLGSEKEIGVLWLVLLWCLFTLLLAVLFPLSHRHILGGQGSDRDDALRVASLSLTHGRYLYHATTYLDNRITPLPGAVLLAVPFFLLGNVSLQNAFWLAIFLGFCCWFFRDRSTALIYVFLMLGVSAMSLDDFVVGGDFVVNAMYVAVAVALVLATHKIDVPLWRQIAAEVFLGLAVDSRPVYVIVFPLLLAYLWQHRERSTAIRALLVAGSVAALLSVPFYLHDPASFAPLHIRHKLDFIPAKYHAEVIFPALGLLASCAGFLIPLSRQRVYLLIGVSLFFIVGLPGLAEWFFFPFTLAGWYGLSLLNLPALFISLWIFSKFQENGCALRLSHKLIKESAPSHS